MMDRDGVYCWRYRSWRRDTRKPGFRTCGARLVDVARDRIEVGGVGASSGIGVSSGECNRAMIIGLMDGTLGE